MMATDSVFCGACGAALAGHARFCPHCGAAQEQFAASTPPPAPPAPQPPAAAPTHRIFPAPEAPPARAPAEDAARRLEQLSPDAGDLARQLGRSLGTPGVALTLFTALGGLAAAIALGLAAALALPDDSYVVLTGGEDELVREAVRFTAATTLGRVSLEGLTTTVVPALFVLAPLLGCALAALAQGPRAAALSPAARFGWAAGAGVPLAVAMLVLAVVANGGDGRDFKVGGVAGLALLWGAAGGVLGTWWSVRGRASAPPVLAATLRAIGTPLRALAVLLLVAGVLGTAAWEVQVLRDQEAAKGMRKTGTAIAETALLAGDNAVNVAGASMFAGMTFPVIPVDDEQAGELYEKLYDDEDDGGEDTGQTRTARIFDYGEVTAPYVFIPALVVAIVLPLVLALYAGFATARRMAARTTLTAIGWGALTGVVWSLALVLLRALCGVIGLDGASLFGFALLIGVVAGGIGGALAGAGTPRTARA